MKKNIATIFAAAIACLCTFTAHATEPARPNILYIALEDITPMMG